jgi:hypothetical protein
MATRRLLDLFQFPNNGYVGCTVTFYVSDANGVATATLATLYDGFTGVGTLANPQDFDSEGKLEHLTYIDVPVVALISISAISLDTIGPICPPGGARGDYVAGGTLYLPGDYIVNGSAGTNTKDVYAAVNLFVSTTWAADSVNATKLKKVIDYVALQATVVPDASTSTKGKIQVATTAEINAANATKAMRPDQFATSKFDPTGKHMIYIPASGMQPDTTTAGGGPSLTPTITANVQIYRTWDFDKDVVESVGFALSWPKSSDEGTITFRPIWTTGGAGDCDWRVTASASGDVDLISQTMSTAIAVVDSATGSGRIARGAESAAITIAGPLVEGDMVFVRVRRHATAGTDTLNADAGLLGLELYLTTNTGNDA